MKSFKNFILLSVFFVSVSFVMSYPVYAGTFTATIDEGGVVKLDADFSSDYDCIPENRQPWSAFSEFLGCYSLQQNSWTIHGERRYVCPKMGRSHRFDANSVGGKIVNGICATASSGSTQNVTEVTDTELIISPPSGSRVRGLTPISVRYDFRYDNADTCTGHVPNRQVGVTYGGNASNLPVRGDLSYQYDFTNAQGVLMITARGCCDGDCRQAESIVYVEPEDCKKDECTKGCELEVGKPVNVAHVVSLK